MLEGNASVERLHAFIHKRSDTESLQYDNVVQAQVVGLGMPNWTALAKDKAWADQWSITGMALALERTIIIYTIDPNKDGRWVKRHDAFGFKVEDSLNDPITLFHNARVSKKGERDQWLKVVSADAVLMSELK